MDLISKKEVINLLEKSREQFRDDADVGRNIREGIDKSICDIEEAVFSSKLFTLENMGQSDLRDLSNKIIKKLDDLAKEPEVKVFCIEGLYCLRYTECHEKAKTILKEVFEEMLNDMDDDHVEANIDISMKYIKQSDLKNYSIE